MKTASWWLSLVTSGMTVCLCFLQSQWWLNTIRIGESLHNGDTEVSHHLRGDGRPVLWLCCALQPFGINTLSQAYALVRINPDQVG
jgi:hypothetical protein